MAEQSLTRYQKQTVFLDALTTMGNIEWACEKAQISRKTYYNWLRDEEFQQKIASRKHLLNQQSVDEMVRLLTYTIGSFEELVRSDDDSIRLKASLAVVKNLNNIMGTIKARDMADSWIEAFIEDRNEAEEMEWEKSMPKQLNFLPDPSVYYLDEGGNYIPK